jgi:hypothetical protein
MNARQKWIQDMMDWCPSVHDPIRSKAIASVRRRQDRAIERFRESIDQDELEVAEFERLVRKEAARIFARPQFTRSRR